MRVVRQREGYARLPVYADEPRGGLVLLGCAVALYFKVKILPEVLAQLYCARLRRLVLAGDYL